VSAFLLTLLEPLETDWHPLGQHDRRFGNGPYDPAVAFRHTGWATDRARVLAAFDRLGIPDARHDSFVACGGHAWVFVDPDNPQVAALRGSNCHDRFCLPCATARSHLIARNLGKQLADSPSRFLTLTLRTDTEPLRESLDRLYASFTKLRRTSLWRLTVDGGVALCELKWSSETSRWHPHLHCLLVGRYVPRDDLRAAWLKATGDSFILDIRYVKQAARVLSYVTKYASKPFDRSFISVPDRLDEAIAALKGRKLVLTFGTWRGVDLTDVGDAPDLVPYCSFRELLARCQRGDTDALSLYSALKGALKCPSIDSS